MHAGHAPVAHRCVTPSGLWLASWVLRRFDWWVDASMSSGGRTTGPCCLQLMAGPTSASLPARALDALCPCPRPGDLDVECCDQDATCGSVFHRQCDSTQVCRGVQARAFCRFIDKLRDPLPPQLSLKHPALGPTCERSHWPKMDNAFTRRETRK